MAEAILSSVTEGITMQLGKAAVKEIALLWGVEDELQRLQGTISTIQRVLLDAENQQSHNNQVRNWLERLEDAVYEADDLADEFATEALRRQVMMRTGNKMVKQVRTFFSTSNQLAFRHKIGSKIRGIRKKLNVIANDRKFHLETGVQEAKVVIGAEWGTHSFVREEDVIGRDYDKMAIMKLLFNMKTEENVGVIPIVGVGGLGKTTLAQLVINDAEVQDHFELIMWVNVPKVFDLEIVVKEIIKSGQKDEVSSTENVSMDQFQKDLREKINGKRYFLVLDDVWNENREKWLSLENLLRNGADGSRIIVTTRSIKVSDVIISGATKPYFLRILNFEKSWDLFRKMAFKQGPESMDLNIVETGKEILKKCGGIPLVIRTIGSMLYSINPEEWSSFKEKELSKISEYEDDILPRLKLSYDRLPSHLKLCFAYCCLFPKNRIIYVEKLVNLWIAQGFIKLSDQHQCLEDTGYQYFKDLLWRSFFQGVMIDDFSNEPFCWMHDCMHDLATSVAGTKGVILNLNDGDDNKIGTRTRHVSFDFQLNSLQQFPASLVQAKRIRTIVLSREYFLPSQVGPVSGKSINNLIDLSFKFLRTLDMHGGSFETLSNSIGQLKHLRCLDLSRNDKLNALPDSITRLQNLQTLNLSNCVQLRALPRDIPKLANLRHLNIHMCYRLTHMPHGIGQLTNLQTLSQFVLNEDTSTSASKHSGELNELENLNLRGNLDIFVNKDGVESKAANLMRKEHLRSLKLHIWGTVIDDCEGLLPHPNIKDLSLVGDRISVRLLDYVPSLTNLVKFSLYGHKECKYLLPLNHLPFLKVLKLEDLPALEHISSDIVDGNSVSSASSSSWTTTRKDVVNGENDTSFATNTAIPIFPHLSRLIIGNCPKLVTMPLFPNLTEALTLKNTSLKPFQKTVNLINVEGQLTSDEASTSTSSAVLPASYYLPLSKLRILCISNEDLQCLPEWFKSLKSLKDLTIRVW